MGYPERDRHIIDYDMYTLPGVAPYPGDGRFRGPRPTGAGYIACVGAAQTFGPFCPLPYPALLSQRLGIATLNLGHGGAGPTFHNGNARLLEYINRARLVIVQVLAARSQSNSMFRTTAHGRDGIRLSDGAKMPAERFYHELLISAPETVPGVIEETRANYVRDMRALLHDIRPPNVLFWFSRRGPDYQEEYAHPVWKMLGAFPQLVNRRMIEQIKPVADAYVECVTSRGLPQPLTDRTGAPTTVLMDDVAGRPVVHSTCNQYYPSPQMHADAALVLEAACRRLLRPAPPPLPAGNRNERQRP